MEKSYSKGFLKLRKELRLLRSFSGFFVTSFFIFLFIVILHFSFFLKLSELDFQNSISKRINSYFASEIFGVKEISELLNSNFFKLKPVFAGINLPGKKEYLFFDFSEKRFLEKLPDDVRNFYPVTITRPEQFLILYFEKKDVEKNLFLSLLCYVSGFFCLFILLVILISFLISKNFISPVEKIEHSINRALNGDYSFKLTWNFSTPEIIRNLFSRYNYLLDILEIEEKEKNFQIYTDGLTHLPNRQKILLDIEQTINPTLILMNIDFFKEINDCFGNTAGDLTLISVGQRLKVLQNRFYFNLYKMSGDEFALLIDRKIELEDLYMTIKNIISEIEEIPFVINGHEIFIKVSIGAARSEDIDPQNLKEGKWKSLATHADMALKKAKKIGKHFLIYHESMEIHKEFERNLIWKKKIKEAINTHRIIPFFQPILNNKTGKIEKYEVLVRIADKESGIITPSYFLEAAKKSHLYEKITKLVLSKAITLFHENNYEFSINLTIQDIIEEDIKNFIFNILEKNKRVAKRVIFEILESEGIENYNEVINFIKRVKDYGCKIAIDDFGSGYSNFDHLMKLDVDYIKIDACLISNIVTDKNAEIITRTISNFAKELNLKTISEFVYSEEIFKKSIELGIDYSQGYYIGKPSENISSVAN